MEELIIPNPSQHDVVSYNILLDGTDMDASYEILSISIDKEINRIPTAKILIKDGDASLAQFEISNKNDFIPGKEIIIKIGFDSTNKQAFKGIITKHQVRVKENGNTQLMIECKDYAMRMTLGRQSKYFLETKDSDVIDTIISNYENLTADVEETQLRHNELIQHHVTDWDYVILRAESNGMLVNVNDGDISVKKPDTSTDPVLQITYGSSILEFEAEMDARSQWTKVQASSWDYKNQALFTAEIDEANSFSQAGNVSGATLGASNKLDQYQLHHSGHLLEQELQSWVDGTMMRSRLAKIRGRARFTGFSDIKPGDMVKIAGIGERFNGNSFVTAVRQDVGDGTWYTNIQFGLSPEQYSSVHPDLNESPSAGLLGAIKGLQIAKVLQLENDPEGEDRILVKIPVIDNSSNGTWVRIACLDAGKDRGSFFRPEIDDEVIVGFINNDPRHAIMLGMLNSSAKPAPLSATDANDEKGFFTRSNMRVHFNDAKKIITIDTPAGNSIVLDEDGSKIEIKDQNANKITMDSSGIKLDSPRDVEIKAGLNLKISAGSAIEITGNSMKVNGTASINLESAITKISSFGVTEISGSLVKIN
ncbi:type VI secretion system tip protein VgrG [Sphingobacterium endophyticum]|uniref:type VI secretion system tip protein VgrG n=1 Tax=Sphingobacterium endophyticum TaxID=2546448 RepID=UPI0012E19400|nr:type VI secretion system tip protein VgrG [Sphingobacterium endophyticum]